MRSVPADSPDGEPSPSPEHAESKAIPSNRQTRLVHLPFPNWIPLFGGITYTLPAPQAALLTASLITIISSLPFLLISYFSPPYITHAHLHLPPHARFSTRHLEKYLRNLTNTPLSAPARVDFITIRSFFPRPWHHRGIRLSELSREDRRLGCANIVWRGQDEKGRWGQRLFYMDERGSPTEVADGGTDAARVLLKALAEGKARRVWRTKTKM